MYRLIRFYNQNRKKVWITIAIIIFAIIVIQILDDLAKAQKEAAMRASQPKKVSVQENYSYSIMSEKKVDTSDTTANNKTVEQFMEYCNSGNVQGAYDLLTDECKNILYPTLDTFINNYYNRIFTNTKTYSMQSWYSDDVDTYKIRIMDDMLSTGTYNNNQVIEDYYTLIKKDGAIKLNVNSYVKKDQINKQESVNGVTVKILEKDCYMDYETYSIEVKNNTKNTIMLDDKTNIKSTYLKGENSTTYSSFIYEVGEDDLIVEPGKTKQVSIKYNKMYQPERKIQSITFSRIILNYEDYKNNQNIAEKSSLTINL